MAASPFLNMDADDVIERKNVSFRTVGDMTCTAAVESYAFEIDDIIDEIASFKISERGARMDDKVSEAAMEDSKKGDILTNYASLVDPLYCVKRVKREKNKK
jgi:sulfate adenylyltransferase subunit 2